MIQRYLRAFLIVAICSTPFLGASQAYAAAADAVPYLQSHEQSPWAVMALSALGNAPDTSFLQSATGTKAIDLEAPILALTAAHQDPRTYPASDLVQGLESFYSGGQIGDPATLNDDLFGVLALVSAGISPQDTVVAGTSAFIKAHQNQDGGWPFMVGDTSDTNDTAAAIMALVAAGTSSGDASIVQGLAYLHGAQNIDGGFPYDPKSQWGTASDADSDAYVMLALAASGVDQSSWAAASGTPMADLLSYQTPAGSFEWQHGTGGNILSTSDAVLALSGKTLPVAILPAPAAPTTPAPTPVPQSTGGGGGGVISGVLSVGFTASSSATTTPAQILVEASSTLGTVLGTSTELVASTTQVSATTTPEVSSYQFASDLQYGMQNGDVASLQKELLAHSLLSIIAPTGWFGPLTFKAVKTFQEQNEIPPTGFVGSLTRASLNAWK
jgi:peptidoglycan hydrolase-like protein with peptidoglycan-binding domain